MDDLTRGQRFRGLPRRNGQTLDERAGQRASPRLIDLSTAAGIESLNEVSQLESRLAPLIDITGHGSGNPVVQADADLVLPCRGPGRVGLAVPDDVPAGSERDAGPDVSG